LKITLPEITLSEAIEGRDYILYKRTPTKEEWAFGILGFGRKGWKVGFRTRHIRWPDRIFEVPTVGRISE
jgi:hypothetical protein